MPKLVHHVRLKRYYSETLPECLTHIYSLLSDLPSMDNSTVKISAPALKKLKPAMLRKRKGGSWMSSNQKGFGAEEDTKPLKTKAHFPLRKGSRERKQTVFFGLDCNS